MTMARFMGDTATVAAMECRTSFRTPVWLFMSLFQPLLWLLLFGRLFEPMVRVPGFGARSYVEFLLPGVMGMTAMFAAGWSGLGLVYDMQRGTLERLLVTPAARASLMMGRIAWWAAVAVVQCLLVLGVAHLMGVRVVTGAPGILGITGILGMFGVALGAFSHALAATTGEQTAVVSTLQFCSVPAMFLSSTLMPLNLAPGWVRQVAAANPLHWAVEGVRILLLDGWQWAVVGRDVGLLALFAGLMVAWAVSSLRRLSA
ncbi:ABC transporter permease [Carboxydochorda subterranea]|uniref:Transport permease protein n=1 Tax=Carboxydichorda subterranea TaxID=3109565 RepID=A0ABZ1C1J5_9FIRM|nr:ABC transporter permease [Limnochorda sp. L945t]WRP18753.1 ABC transporter permease [Limnochorda sp. L945t]